MGNICVKGLLRLFEYPLSNVCYIKRSFSICKSFQMIQIIANVPSFSPLRDKMHLELLDPLLSFHLRTILVVCEICQLLKSSLEFEKKGIIVSTTVESNSKLSTTTMKNSRFDEELSNGGDVSHSLLENRCHCYSFLKQYICI